ncbi:MAG TPA: hypothetical protein VMS12_06710 [Thermoanaerobaculia bacterium]|nr:hypothetical protein [Thermoanaerobaculia bacterium]
MGSRPIHIVRTLAGIIAFGAVLAGSFQPFYLQPIYRGRAALSAQLTELRFGKAPELRGLLSEVRQRTEPGDRIALIAPVHRWHEGYAYAYYRASYELAGREVVPLVTWWDEQVPDNLRFANYVLAWNSAFDLPQFEPVWTGEAGTLYRRLE